MIPPFSRFLPAAASCFTVGIALLCSQAALRAENTFKTIYAFTPDTDGNVPYPALAQGADGRFYGTNSTGGKNNTGTVFSIKADGTGFNVLSSFPDTNGGSQPRAGVVQARDGNFYGTTYAGGSNGVGVLYQVTPAGTLTYLTSFNDVSVPGANPVGTLTEGLDGLLYGTAQYGGSDNYGTVYRVTVPAGTATTFATITGGLAGYYPQSDLIQARDSNFYGTTLSGGAYNNGTFFRITPAGVFTTLYSFTGSADGGSPIRGVVQGIDGAFYGATQTGGGYASGALYRLVVSGDTANITALHSFETLLGEGMTPDGSLVAATDGNLYGTTSAGGAYNSGTVFRVTTTGGFATVYSFTNGTAGDGGFPVGGLTIGNDGKLYGTTAGQNGSSGTIFKIDLNAPLPAPVPLSALVPTAAFGDTVLIKGDYFVGATAVNFVKSDGSAIPAASFTVESKTIIAAVVPDGAVTGVISVTANGLTASTPYALTVTGGTPVVVVPSVSVIARIPTAAEGGASGKFKFVRSGSDFTDPLKVHIKLTAKSTATLGQDYTFLVGKGGTLAADFTSVTIPAGSASVVLKVIPIDDAIPEPPETVILKVKTGDGYTVDSTTFKATVTITDNDSNN